MLKNLVPHGNSAALIIDKPILGILKVDMNAPLEITTDGENLIISPVRDKDRDKKFRADLVKVNKKHGKKPLRSWLNDERYPFGFSGETLRCHAGHFNAKAQQK